MKIKMRIHGSFVTLEVSKPVYLFLKEAKRKEENLAHEQRRHWDDRCFDENVTVQHSNHRYQLTPEELVCQKETMHSIMETLAVCTPVQRERFLLYALYGLSFAEIAKRQNCSKYAVRDSIQSVRKKFQTIFKKRPHDLPFSGL